jgi:hypothetical protein
MAPRRVGIIPGWDTSQQCTASSGGCCRSCHTLRDTHRGSCHRRRPRKCWQTGSRQRRDGLGSASLSGSSTREHRGFFYAVQRSVIVTRRIRCAGCKEAATPNKLYVAIYGTESLHLCRSRSHRAHTDLPVWTGSPHLGPRAYGALPHGSRPTLKIADKYKSRRSHRDLRTPLWRAENEAAFPNLFVIPYGATLAPT